ncbi:50S ribosomal protein L34 [Candidatus Dojkabacteria bacterium]|nr:50S ribosomal protein L34 [Candidatus Dojkabacteria bacterium]
MPKRTFQPKKKRRIRRLGFLKRMTSNGGRNILKRKRAKGRKSLSASDEVRADKNKKFSRRR